MAKAKVVVTGDREIDALLKVLPARVAKKVLRKSMRSAMKQMQGEVKQELGNAIEDSSSLQSEVKVRSGKRSTKSVSMEVRADQEGYPDAGHHEYGTAHEAPKPAWRPTFDSKGEKIKKQVLNELPKIIEDEARKG